MQRISHTKCSLMNANVHLPIHRVGECVGKWESRHEYLFVMLAPFCDVCMVYSFWSFDHSHIWSNSTKWLTHLLPLHNNSNTQARLISIVAICLINKFTCFLINNLTRHNNNHEVWWIGNKQILKSYKWNETTVTEEQ